MGRNNQFGHVALHRKRKSVYGKAGDPDESLKTNKHCVQMRVHPEMCGRNCISRFASVIRFVNVSTNP